MQLILASTSPYRKQLLHNIGIPVLCMASDVDEDPICGSHPIETSQLRAKAKSKFVAQKYCQQQSADSSLDMEEDVIVIGADQVVYIDQEIFGKPKDTDEWMSRLQKFSGRDHQLTTSVSLWGFGPNISETPQEIRLFSEHTTIFFRNLSSVEIENYVLMGEAQNCAGGYMIEGLGASLIDHIEGDYQNVIGLPIFALLQVLREFKFSVLESISNR